MKRAVLAVLAAALVSAGVAVAQGLSPPQPQAGIIPTQRFGPPEVQALGSHWTDPELWDGYEKSGASVSRDGPLLPSDVNVQVAAGLRTAVPQMRLACAADRASLCGDKTTDLGADRCLEYHRPKLSRPCKAAWDKVTLAAEGRL